MFSVEVLNDCIRVYLSQRVVMEQLPAYNQDKTEEDQDKTVDWPPRPS